MDTEAQAITLVRELNEVLSRYSKQKRSDSLAGRIEAYLDAVADYERCAEAQSYSVIEGPKIEIADAVLSLLGLPTGPRPINRRARR